MVSHKRHANLPRSLDMHYSLGNIGSEKQATQKLIVALLDKVPKSNALRSNKLSEGNLLILNGPKGVLDIRLVR